jgi:hypothetical protein
MRLCWWLAKLLRTYAIRVAMLLPLVMIVGCSSEPDFSVVGDPDILDKVQINLFIGRDARVPNAPPSTFETLFINGKIKKIDYGKVYSYSIYIKYDNRLFGYYNHENFMHDLYPGKPWPTRNSSSS